MQASRVGNTAEWQKFVFPANVTLSGSTKYWIVLHGDYAKDNAHHVTWRADTTSSGFAGGELAKHTDGGAWAVDSDDDFLFRVLEETAGTDYQLASGTLEFEFNTTSAIYYTIEVNLTSKDLYGIKVNWLATGLSSVLIEIRISDDAISWGAWEQWFAVDYDMKFYQIRMTFTRTSLSTVASVTELAIVADQLT